jgi:hypothetical protein
MKNCQYRAVGKPRDGPSKLSAGGSLPKDNPQWRKNAMHTEGGKDKKGGKLKSSYPLPAVLLIGQTFEWCRAEGIERVEDPGPEPRNLR